MAGSWRHADRARGTFLGNPCTLSPLPAASLRQHTLPQPHTRPRTPPRNPHANPPHTPAHPLPIPCRSPTPAEKLRLLALDGERRFPDFDYDVEAEIESYRAIAEQIRPYVRDTVHALNEWVAEGRKVLVEGANATMLDLDFGTYPFVTSSNPSIGGVLIGLGLAPSKLGAIVGVVRGRGAGLCRGR